MEFGEAIAEAMATALGGESALRGSRWSFRKDGGRLRGRIGVTYEGQALSVELLPDPDDVKSCLRRQWGESAEVPGVGMPVMSRRSGYQPSGGRGRDSEE